MTDKDELIDHYWSLRPTLFNVLDVMRLHQRKLDEDAPVRLELELVLRAFEQESDDRERLRLVFFGVTDLELSGTGFVVFPLLEIFSIQDFQWEHLKYRVKETENGELSFYCESFTATVEVV